MVSEHGQRYYKYSTASAAETNWQRRDRVETVLQFGVITKSRRM